MKWSSSTAHYTEYVKQNTDSFSLYKLVQSLKNLIIFYTLILKSQEEFVSVYKNSTMFWLLLGYNFIEKEPLLSESFCCLLYTLLYSVWCIGTGECPLIQRWWEPINRRGGPYYMSSCKRPKKPGKGPTQGSENWSRRTDSTYGQDWFAP